MSALHQTIGVVNVPPLIVVDLESKSQGQEVADRQQDCTNKYDIGKRREEMCSDEILLRGGKIPLAGQASCALARVRDDNLLQCGWQFLEPSPSPPFEGGETSEVVRQHDF